MAVSIVASVGVSSIDKLWISAMILLFGVVHDAFVIGACKYVCRYMCVPFD
jgi:hypothetical protein